MIVDDVGIAGGSLDSAATIAAEAAATDETEVVVVVVSAAVGGVSKTSAEAAQLSCLVS